MWEEPVHRRAILVSVFALLILSAMSLLRANSARAGAEFTVDDTADALDANPGDGACATSSGLCTLRAAIMETNALVGADTVILPSGVYTLTIPGPGEDMATLGDLDITDDLTLAGAGAESTIIDGNGGVVQDRVMHLLGPGIQVTIFDVTIRNGLAQSGGSGGIRIDESELALSESVIAENTYNGISVRGEAGKLAMNNCIVSGNSGVGLLVSIGELEVENSIIQDNQSGGIRTSEGVLMLNNSMVRGNRTSNGDDGGGIGNGSESVAILTNSVIQDNTASDSGGGIYNYATMTIISSTICGNVALCTNSDQGGAGVFNEGQLTIADSIVCSNTVAASYDGGGILAFGSVHLANSTVSGNRAGRNGGGIAWGVALNNVTITGNTAHGDGGGIYQGFGEAFQAANSVIAGNIDNSKGTDHPDCSGTLISQGYNIIGDTAGCFIGGNTTGHLTGVDPLLELLKDNGGPTLTHALLPGSPAIDAGNPAGCTDHLGDPLLTDQRGMPRVGRCDMGAYEATSPDPYRKTASPSSILPGDPLTYTISFENLETVDITDVRVTDTLPTLVTYLDNSLTATGGSYGYADGVVTWTGAVSAGGNVAVRFGVTVSQTASLGSSISNSAVFSGGGEIISRTATVFVGHQIYLPVVWKSGG